MREHSEEEILDIEEEVKLTKDKVNDLGDVLVDQHAKNKKLKDTIHHLEKELELYKKTQAPTKPATSQPVAGPSSWPAMNQPMAGLSSCLMAPLPSCTKPGLTA